MSDRLNIVIPMAGKGKRFQDVGYTVPKPLIPIHGKEMIRWVIENVTPKRNHRFIFIALREHEVNYDLTSMLKKYCKNCEVILLNEVTEGAACSVLKAKNLINSEEPLMTVNSDQWLDIKIDDFLTALDHQPDTDSVIMTMNANDEKWSYVELDESKKVIRVTEKEVISNEATVGIYTFKKGKDFVNAAEKMIQKNLRVKGEFYVAPVYNEMIANHAKIKTYNVGSVSDKFFSLGTPEDLEAFLRNPISKRCL